jgi:hypothetical protein
MTTMPDEASMSGADRRRVQDTLRHLWLLQGASGRCLWSIDPGALKAIVAGSRERSLADARKLNYTSAAEILFLLETLEKPQ